MAVFPGGLAWAWQSLKPLYANGAVSAQATALRAGLDIPKLPGLSAPALAAAGLSRDDLAWIAMIQASYERSNAMNMIALGALLAQLEGGPAAPTAKIIAAASPSYGDEKVVAGEMPLLLTLDAMNADLRALVEALNRIGGRDEILASMYRHLAHWPPYLAHVGAVLWPYLNTGEILRAGASITRVAEVAADELVARLPATSSAHPSPTPEQAAAMMALLNNMKQKIPEMILICKLLSDALPSRIKE